MRSPVKSASASACRAFSCSSAAVFQLLETGEIIKADDSGLGLTMRYKYNARSAVGCPVYKVP